MKQKELIEILNDLTRINKDRIEGYIKAVKELDKHNTGHFIRHLLEDRIKESSLFHSELSAAITLEGGEPQKDGTPEGQLFRLWMDLKTTFTDGSTKSVLALCEYGEEVALKTYDKALAEVTNWDPKIFTMLTEQRRTLREAHDLLKRHRDNLEKV